MQSREANVLIFSLENRLNADDDERGAKMAHPAYCCTVKLTK
jgi:hypothetical protein